MSVSYTHLDVYKRQYQCSDDLRGVFHNRKKRTRRKVGGENMFLGIYDYTDVYKRQEHILLFYKGQKRDIT